MNEINHSLTEDEIYGSYPRNIKLYEQMSNYERLNQDSDELFQKNIEIQACDLFADYELLYRCNPDLFIIRRNDKGFFEFVYSRCMNANFLKEMRKTDSDAFVIYVAKQCFYLGCIATGDKKLKYKSLDELTDDETETLLKDIFNRSSSNIYLEKKGERFVKKIEKAITSVTKAMLPKYREDLKDDNNLIMFMQSFYRIGRIFNFQYQYKIKEMKK